MCVCVWLGVCAGVCGHTGDRLVLPDLAARAHTLAGACVCLCLCVFCECVVCVCVCVLCVFCASVVCEREGCA